ncbi:MAG: NADH/ubiquinone/plastoquinone (complex I), partial [Spirochaetes bacterium]|nr:NADH/ubiquinone/plastoquinone (complex I) [Spirochaetota bacterium]
MNTIPLFVLLPLVAGILISLVGKRLKFISALLTNLVLLFLTVFAIFLVIRNDALIVYQVGGWGSAGKIPFGIFLVVDGLSRVLLVIINLIGFCAGLFSVSYIKKYTGTEKYFALFCLMIAGMNGVAISGDLFNIFVFLEISAIASYALVAFGIKKEELEASFKYQVLGGLSSMMILLGIGMTYWLFKTVNIADIAVLMKNAQGLKAVFFIQALFLMGFGLKAAMVPFHSWLPDAHSSAPSPISAMLSGVLIKAIGVYLIMRLFFNMFTVNYNYGMVIVVIGTLSMVVGGILAIGQWDFKRLLAYSSISQIGYVVTAIGVAVLILARKGSTEIAALALLGGVFHLFNHAIFKGLLFLTAGSVEHRTGV